jgi:hypothetical protein
MEAAKLSETQYLLLRLHCIITLMPTIHYSYLKFLRPYRNENYQGIKAMIKGLSMQSKHEIGQQGMTSLIKFLLAKLQKNISWIIWSPRV